MRRRGRRLRMERCTGGEGEGLNNVGGVTLWVMGLKSEEEGLKEEMVGEDLKM